MKKRITIIMRLQYLRNLFNEQSGKQHISFPEFIECLFSKLEQELRTNTSGVEKYIEQGEDKTLPLRTGNEEFEYIYTR
jgi:hypothetical protein